MKFLFELFPIFLFFVAFKIWGIYTATAVSIVATIIQIIWSAARHRRVEPMMWVSLGIILVFGGATLMLHNETFIKWKPTALYWALSVVLLIAHLMGKRPLEAIMGKQISLPDAVWTRLGLAWTAFFALIGVLNLIVAYHFSTDAWVTYKLFGSTGMMLVFILAQSIWLTRHIKTE